MSQPQYPSQQPYAAQQPHVSQQPWTGGGEPPLWAPWYGAPFTAAAKRFFKKYATFSGRASRSEYWWWTLVSVLVSVVLNIMINAGVSYTAYGSTAGPGTYLGLALAAIWVLAVIIPSLALSVRRLHDSNKSGWLLLLGLIPFAGAIILLVFMLLGPDPRGQQYDQPMA
ncbi:DUF805 domain-containing protein [Pseudarthrobacter sp. BIM B-2242]|uniref:DUF805 domain-containing protein n=1 Tax=Pseudarthrobacter sp. BIM B-2242 TaxID=2772401 RepID=UPI00168B650B|nr:DUF805 domain-containing protein [Pseudarthrobacter sp. BIM B-2242]QOD05828.1 DUF805 domain-containing protein [Pseudarthrobacter sp. BIM B-2242]